jgi:hypothetical protein
MIWRDPRISKPLHRTAFPSKSHLDRSRTDTPAENSPKESPPAFASREGNPAPKDYEQYPKPFGIWEDLIEEFTKK